MRWLEWSRPPSARLHALLIVSLWPCFAAPTGAPLVMEAPASAADNVPLYAVPGGSPRAWRRLAVGRVAGVTPAREPASLLATRVSHRLVPGAARAVIAYGPGVAVAALSAVASGQLTVAALPGRVPTTHPKAISRRAY
jgi:hypothetical protein